MRKFTALIFAVVSGCGGGGSTTPQPSLTKLTVTLSATSVQVGANVSATVNGFDQSGASIGVGSVSWSASPTAIATITSGGVVTAVSPGSAAIRATSGTIEANATLTVTAPAPATCGTEAALTIDQVRNGNLLASQCTFLDTPAMFTFRAPFAGPQAGGTYFYDRYTIDIPAGQIVRFDVANVANTINYISIAYDPSGSFQAYGIGTSSPLVINNASTSLRRYQIIISSSRAVQTGTYTVLPKRIL